MVIVKTSVVTCPMCGARQQKRMPYVRRDTVHYCRACGSTTLERPGACCIYCSFGDVPCPAAQRARLMWAIWLEGA